MSQFLSPMLIAEKLARDFFDRVWTPPHEIDAIDDLMTEDYTITTAGTTICGRSAFKDWVADFHRRLPDATNQILDIFANAAGDRVVARWICSGRNNGLLGLPPDNQPVAFSGIAIWAVRDARLSECWVERAGLELYQQLTRSAPGGDRSV